MEKETKKSSRPKGPFDFCSKHRVFFKSCGCSWEKGSKKEELEVEETKDADN